MSQEHRFEGRLDWQGQPPGTPFTYETIRRVARLEFDGGAALEASAPAVFHGDDSLANPETLMMASLMQCHFLTFMAVAAKSRAEVVEYSDRATGTLGMKDGRMRFVEVVLRPRVRLADAAQAAKLESFHSKAHANCFMSNSVNFPVRVEPDLG
ncbi:MAG TPA: OsmC family protein [Burkholderiaceae bacterium]|nr:OsmC family protein [Burkholderiaceae bacterium]